MKSIYYIILTILIIVAAGFFMFNGSATNGAGNVTNDNSGELQQVVLSQDGYNYQDIIAEAGKPISLSADNSVGGCLRSVAFTLDGKRYSKYLQTPKDTLELPALSEGTYSFSCSMGMGYGKLIVK